MINPSQLLPAVKKLLPEYSDQELMEGIAEFSKAHPDFNNQQALEALAEAIKHPTVQNARQSKVQQPSQPPFSGLMSQLGAH